MMPIPVGVSKSVILKTDKDTGLWMLDQTKSILIERGLLVLILTNRIPDTFQDYVERLNNEIRETSGRSKDQVGIVTKAQCTAAQIPAAVEAMLGRFA
jgi:hypothetical protein